MISEKEKSNPFKLIHRVEELPPELKQEVLASVRSAILFKNIGKLFSQDMSNSFVRMIDIETGKKDT